MDNNTTLTYNDLMKFVEGINETTIESKEIVLFYGPFYIGCGLSSGIFDDVDGFVKYGGIKIIDTLTQKEAETKDYIVCR